VGRIDEILRSAHQRFVRGENPSRPMRVPGPRSGPHSDPTETRSRETAAIFLGLEVSSASQNGEPGHDGFVSFFFFSNTISLSVAGTRIVWERGDSVVMIKLSVCSHCVHQELFRITTISP
jgi:hypothetical protein